MKLTILLNSPYRLTSSLQVLNMAFDTVANRWGFLEVDNAHG